MRAGGNTNKVTGRHDGSDRAGAAATASAHHITGSKADDRSGAAPYGSAAAYSEIGAQARILPSDSAGNLGGTILNSGRPAIFSPFILAGSHPSFEDWAAALQLPHHPLSQQAEGQCGGVSSFRHAQGNS